jgi:hypothetical protein
MADPLTEIFGRRPFRGTGVVDDYFPEAPDLSYLGRPSFIPRGAGYNPNLDPQGLAAAGFSPRNIMRLQGIRQDLHAQAEQQRMAQDEGSALDALSKIDPANRNFSTQLLDIFRKNHRAQQSPNVMGQVELLSRFAPKTPQWSVEDIDDPDIYDLAVQENWSKLSPAEARRKASRAMMQRQMRGELAGLGLPQKELERDWTQEDYLREKGRLMRESKATSVKPWMERLSDKEAAAVRAEVQSSMAPEDFTAEFAAIQKDNPNLTEEEYVKKYKGVNSLDEYRLRRAMESGAPQKIMREYGLTQDEVADLFGVRGRMAQPASVNPWEDRTTLANPNQEIPASVSVSETVTPSAVSESVAVTDDPNDPFNKVRKEIRAEDAAAKTGRASDFDGRQLARDAESQQWESAKGKLLGGIDKDIIKTLSPSPTEETFTKIFKNSGIDPSKPAFSKPDGTKVSWYEALVALANDPRTQELQRPFTSKASSQSGTSPSGAKVVIGQPRKIQ